MVAILISRRDLLLSAIATVATGGSASAIDSYPTRSATVVVPYPAGNAIDTLTRVIGDKLATRLLYRWVIENKAGVGGNLGTSQVAKAAPDGYTLLISASGPLAIAKTLSPNLNYDPEKDFEPILLFAIVPNVLVVNPRLPVRTVQEFINYAKERPRTLNYGSVGNGSSQHLAAAYFEQVTGIRMTHVAYRAATSLVTDLLRGELHCSFQLVPNVLGQLQAGEVRALGVADGKRLSGFPDVPTMAEAGVANYESSAWFGLLAPKGTPKPILAKLEDEMAAAMADPAMQERFFDLGAQPASLRQKEFTAFISAEVVKWRNIINRGDIKVE
jgi:tripartite-type tricarboxylate transporter receptor subunit TctC